MPSLRSVVLCLSAAVILSPGSTAHRTQPKSHQRSQSSEISQDGIPMEESLHRALHSIAPAFKDGVFESPHAAVSALTEEDPVLADQVIAAARYDLLKRQSGNNSTTSTASTTTSSADPTSSTSSTITTSSVQSTSFTSSSTLDDGPSSTTPTTVSSTPTVDSSSTLETPSVTPSSSISTTPVDSTTFVPPPTSSDSSSSPTDVYVPVPVTSINGGSTQVSTALSAVPITASVTIPITTTNAQGQTITTDTVVPALIYTSIDAQGHTFLVTDLLPGSEPTPTDSLTATGLASATPLHPVASGAVRSVITETTVVAGAPTVVTRTIVVLPTDAPGIDAQPVEATGTNAFAAAPSLQAGAATGMRSVGKEIVALVGAAVGIAMLL